MPTSISNGESGLSVRTKLNTIWTNLVTSQITLGDDEKAIFGAGSDLQIYHTGSQSIISDVGGGNLNLEGESKIVLRSAGGTENYAQFFKDGAVELYHNNSVKFATTSTGIDVTGAAGADLSIIAPTDNVTLKLRAGNSDSGVEEANILFYQNNAAKWQLGNGTDNAFKLYNYATSAYAFVIAADGSLSTPTAGTSNVRFGVNAGNSIASGGNYNVVVGDEAGTNLTTGDSNTLIGYLAGEDIVGGGNNVAIGYETMKNEDGHGQNTAVGTQALFALNAGTDAYNTAVGFQAGGSVSIGIDNTLIGALAGDAINDADYNVAVGKSSLGTNTVGSHSVAVGRNALFYQNPSSATDMYNTAVGSDAGKAVTTGVQNTLIGGQAGSGLTTGTLNTIVGASAGAANTFVASAVTLLGYNAGNAVTSTGADGLTAIGKDACELVTSVAATAVGANALASLISGAGNTAVGQDSLNATTSANNTAIGAYSGLNNTSGSNNLFLGVDAGRTGSPGGNLTTQSNEIVLGDENISEAHIQVDWTVASDQRDKTDFTALDLGLNFVKALAPVTYKWDKRSKYGDKTADDYDINAQSPDGTHKEDWLDIGFKAQEVQALEEAAGYTTADKKNLTVSTSGDGKQMGLQYSKFVPILVKAIQEQNALIEALTARVATLEG